MPRFCVISCSRQESKGNSGYPLSRVGRISRVEKFYCATAQENVLDRFLPEHVSGFVLFLLSAGIEGRSGSRASRHGCEPGSRKFLSDGEEIIRERFLPILFVNARKCSWQVPAEPLLYCIPRPHKLKPRRKAGFWLFSEFFRKP